MATSFPASNDVDLLLNNSTARLPFRHQSSATSVNNNRLHTYTTTRISINSSPSSNGGQASTCDREWTEKVKNFCKIPEKYQQSLSFYGLN